MTPLHYTVENTITRVYLIIDLIPGANIDYVVLDVKHSLTYSCSSSKSFTIVKL